MIIFNSECESQEGSLSLYSSPDKKCKNKATHVRWWTKPSHLSSSIGAALCDKHAAEWELQFRSDTKFGFARIAPIIEIDPGSELHCSLDVAFHTLVYGDQST